MSDRMRMAWVTWEHQRRNHSVASGLDIPLFEFNYRGARLPRYVRAVVSTIRALWSVKPDVLFVQNPSIVLSLTGVVWSRLWRRPLVVDAHNSAIEPLLERRGVLSFLSDIVARRAALTIVSNRGLMKAIEDRGGTPFVLPDRIPELDRGVWPHASPGTKRVMFICTYRDDEPYEAVFDAARGLEDDTVIYVTGRLRPETETTRRNAPPNVVFTDYLPDQEFVGLLNLCDVVMDLTTREDCLVCGAYEAVAVGKPMILSDSRANREYFSRGAVYTDHTPEDILCCIRKALGDAGSLARQVCDLRGALVEDWIRSGEVLKRQVTQLRLDS